MNKTGVFRFRVTPADRAAIAELAKQNGTEQSEAVRRALYAALKSTSQATSQDQANQPQHKARDD